MMHQDEDCTEEEYANREFDEALQSLILAKGREMIAKKALKRKGLDIPDAIWAAAKDTYKCVAPLGDGYAGKLGR